MAVHAVQREMTSVEKETFLRIGVEITQTKRLPHAVNHLAVFQHADFDGVHKRVAAAVPQPGIVNLKFEAVRLRHGAGKHCHALLARKQAAVAVKHLDTQCNILGARGASRKTHTGCNTGMALAHRVLTQIHSRRSVIEQGDADGVAYNEVDITVKSAIEIEVANQRHHIELFAVVHSQQQRIILTVVNEIGNFEHKCGITSAMFAHVPAVDKQVAHTVGAVAFHVKALPPEILAHRNCLGIVAYSTLIVYLTYQGIRGVPRMRKVNPARIAVVYLMGKAELPVAVQRNCLSRRCKRTGCTRCE